ncbi:MAG: PAS domain-containing protein [Gammaproteobacteria bacterium]|nr:PAS domain-containing protein [Gammaproteobacteria bacterium]
MLNVAKQNDSDSASNNVEALQEAFSVFNNLSEQLASSYHDLEDHVDKLKGELEEANTEKLAHYQEKERLADRLNSLLTALPAGVVVLDATGRIQEANTAAITLLGEPLVGELWRDIIVRAFDATKDYGVDLCLHDGRIVSLSTCPLGNEPGQILMLTDVTERRQLQEKMSQHKRLSAMGEMAASLAHQIRTPLSSAMLYLSHLRQPELADDKRLKFAAKVSDSVQHLEKLVKDMLIFAKGNIGAGEQVSVSELIDSVIHNIDAELDKTETELLLDDEAGQIIVRCNRDVLVSALINLANNAIQAMSSKGELTIQTQASDEAVDIVIADNGPGMDLETQARIFEPFYTTRANGTGLGLAVVQAVARAHKGELWLQSEPGQGSRFGIRLPIQNLETGE